MEPDTQSPENGVSTEPATASDSTTAPSETPEVDTPSFGWNRYAERINGRFAMIGFVALLIQELVTRKGFFTWLGL